MSLFQSLYILRFSLCFLVFLTFSQCSPESCKIGVLYGCGKNETCRENINTPGQGTCECLLQYVRKDGNCVLSLTSTTTPSPSGAIIPNNDRSSSSRSNDFGVAVWWWLIVPCAIVGIVGGSLYLGRRYMLMDWLYQLRIRNYDTVLINNQGDDDDDPPIA